MICVIKTQILDGLDQKSNSEGWPSVKFINLRLVIGMILKFYYSVAKGLTLKRLGVGGRGRSQFDSPLCVSSFPCYEEINDVSSPQMMSAFFHF